MHRVFHLQDMHNHVKEAGTPYSGREGREPGACSPVCAVIQSSHQLPVATEFQPAGVSPLNFMFEEFGGGQALEWRSGDEPRNGERWAGCGVQEAGRASLY